MKIFRKQNVFWPSDYFDPEKFADAQQTFFHCTRFFLFWLWCNEMFVRTFLQGQICSYIASSHLYHLLIRVKVQNCHGGKKTAFFSPVTRSRALFDKISLGWKPKPKFKQPKMSHFFKKIWAKILLKISLKTLLKIQNKS